jgi:hypothetical protein
MAMAVSLALVSHRHFQVRNGDRWLRDHHEAVWNAYGVRTIRAQRRARSSSHAAVYVMIVQ